MKICLVGDKCGKTSIVQRWTQPKKPIKDENTLAVDMRTMTVSVDNEPEIVQMWDCSGEKYYMNLLDKYLFNSNVIVICFDLTSTNSWLVAQYWIDRTREKTRKIPICVIGNKLDKESQRRIKDSIVKSYLKSIEHPYTFYCETSAYTGENCKDTLRMIVRESGRTPHMYTVNDFKKVESRCTIS